MQDQIVLMNERCPKCGSDSYLSEEEMAGVVDKSDPPKVAIKQIFKCKACGEKFSRLVFENLDVKKKTEAKKLPDLFEGFHKPGVGLDEDPGDKVEVY
jgi:transposase-like protein